MKIGIITTQFAINYGAVLQAYSLKRTIEKLGYSCEIINYMPNNKVDGRKIIYKFKNIKSSIYSLLLFLNFKFKKEKKVKIEKFNVFIDKHCSLSDSKFSSYNDLRNNLPFYDCLICGSDQIWNLNLFDDPTFFLRFEDIYPKTNYIAYAPSIAENLSQPQIEKLANNIRHFKSISIREKESCKLLETNINRKVENVLDPVFLSNKEDWGAIEEPVCVEKPYILSYALAAGKKYSQTINALKNKHNLKVVHINLDPFQRFKVDYSLSNLSPGNFVWLFKNAQYICTSSFHGTAFSILFEKQFFSIPAKFRNSRIKNILNHLSIQERLIDDNDIIQEKIIIDDIDYSKVSHNLEQLKSRSIAFLDKSISFTFGKD